MEVPDPSLFSPHQAVLTIPALAAPPAVFENNGSIIGFHHRLLPRRRAAGFVSWHHVNYSRPSRGLGCEQQRANRKHMIGIRFLPLFFFKSVCGIHGDRVPYRITLDKLVDLAHLASTASLS